MELFIILDDSPDYESNYVHINKKDNLRAPYVFVNKDNALNKIQDIIQKDLEEWDNEWVQESEI